MGICYPPGTAVRDCVIERTIDFGGEGIVFLARRGSDQVALKQYNFQTSDPKWAADVESVRRLERLIGKHHPHVCPVLDIFEYDDHLYQVMEFVPGTPMIDLVGPGKPVPLDSCAQIAEGLFTGLQWLHDQAIVHRDIKPHNIMVQTGPDGRWTAVLVDFGLFLHRDLPRLTRTKDFMGTEVYTAPELVTGGEDVDGRADIHSAGAVLFEALTGALPFEHMSKAEVLSAVCLEYRPSLRSVCPGLSEDLDHFVQRLMARYPDDRPDTALQAWEEFRNVLEHLGADWDASATLDHSSARPSRVAPSPAPAAPPRVTAKSTGCIIIGSGPLAGRSIAVPPGGVSLGRHMLNPGDTAISRFHVRARLHTQGLLLRDLGSRNGLLYKGRRLRRLFLPSKEEVTVGATTIKTG